MAEQCSTVLIIDDNAVIRKLAKTVLSKRKLSVVSAGSGTEGIQMAHTDNPQVILLDVMMPEMDGVEVCKILKANDATMDIPIIMVSSKTESVDKIKALKTGAADYVTKPFDHGELLARVETQIKLKTLWDELQKKNKILEDLIKKDGLTNLYNHRHFQEHIFDEFNRSQRYNFPLCCVLIDIDHFKNINDTYGHQAGDEILKGLAKILQKDLRDIDLAARYGGEEFALILPHTNIEQAIVMAERLRSHVSSQIFIFNGQNISITISQGVACIPINKAENHSEIIKFADEALYAAKTNGRNRVEVCKNR